MVLSFFIGLMQLRSSVSQSRVFACGSMVHADRSVCGFSARSAEKPHTIKGKYFAAEGSARQLRKSYFISVIFALLGGK